MASRPFKLTASHDAPPRRIQLRAHKPDGTPYLHPITIEELRHVCAGLSKALLEESQASEANVVVVGAGVRHEVVASGSVYAFALTAPTDADEGDPVMVRVGVREVDGTVVSCDEDAIRLTLSEDLGPAISAGTELLLDGPGMALRLRQRVREAFEIGRGTPRLFNLDNALRTLGIGEIEVQSVPHQPVYENASLPLNEAQARAVDVAFRSPISVIAAAAGTGKTLTLGALVEAAYRAGLRTLVTAPSNVAVDLQMMQVCGRLDGEEEFDSACVLRVGDDAGPDLRGTYGDNVVLEEVIARLRPNLKARLDRALGHVDRLASRLTAVEHVTDATARSTAPDQRQALKRARAALRKVEREAREYGRTLTAGAQVVGATLARVFMDGQLGQFDLVVIDEASMAQGPAVFLASGLARRHVVIAGDPIQLAAPARSNGVHRTWLSVDVFQRLDVVGAIKNEENVDYLTVLEEQRRCAEDICGMLRHLWYRPSLRTAPEVFARERARRNLVFGTQSLCFIDTSALGARAHKPWKDSGSYANDVHADVIFDLVAYLDSAGEIPSVGTQQHEVTVMSYYRAQVAAIRRRLASYEGRGVAVRTVHRSQGAECTTAVFDLTLASNVPTRVSSILTAVQPHQDGSRILAVAASRPKSRFVFIGDMSWIRQSVVPNSMLARLARYLIENGHSIPLREIRGTAALPALRMVR